MADKEHFAKLMDAFNRNNISFWNNWRKGNRDIQPDLSNTDLSRADLDKFNLSKANLNGTNLSGANIRGANLSEASLIEASLSRVDLTNSNLSGANLRGANIANAYLDDTYLIDAYLVGVDLSGSYLTSADLRGADLTGAYLVGVDLTEANMEGAILVQTLFINVDLSNVNGLDEAIHRGPSTIDIDTLYRSEGNIPEVFLRGCGVPDTMITFAKSLVGKAIDYYSCFISYSTVDEEFASLLHAKLRAAGIRVWYAPEQLLPGQRIDEEIEYGIRYWDKILFCASKSSLTEKWWVDFEIDKGFKKARDLQRERGEPVNVIIPLNLDGYLFSDAYKDNPKRSNFEMSYVQDFVGWKNDLEKFNRGVEKVIRALQTSGAREDPPESKL